MPKIIEDVKKRILKTSKKRLLSDGYSRLAIRDIAADCDIAVGTVYNYFKSKDMLVGAVMVEDWRRAVERMSGDCRDVKSLNDGLRAIYDGIVDFSAIYKSVWREYSFTGSSLYSFSERHLLLRSQLVEIILPLLSRFRKDEDEFVPVFLAECLLTASSDRTLEYKKLDEIFKRLFK